MGTMYDMVSLRDQRSGILIQLVVSRSVRVLVRKPVDFGDQFEGCVMYPVFVIILVQNQVDGNCSEQIICCLQYRWIRFVDEDRIDPSERPVVDPVDHDGRRITAQPGENGGEIRLFKQVTVPRYAVNREIVGVLFAQIICWPGPAFQILKSTTTG